MTATTVILRDFDGCPNAGLAHSRLAEALRRVGLDPVIITLGEISTTEDAERLDFCGSPTILINGHDPFGDPIGPSWPAAYTRPRPARRARQRSHSSSRRYADDPDRAPTSPACSTWVSRVSLFWSGLQSPPNSKEEHNARRGRCGGHRHGCRRRRNRFRPAERQPPTARIRCEDCDRADVAAGPRYGWYEIRILRGADVDDPVIAAGATIQRWLASGLGWLAWPEQPPQPQLRSESPSRSEPWGQPRLHCCSCQAGSRGV